MIPQLQRAWVAEWPKSDGRPSGLVSLCMRFNQDADGPGIEVMLLRRSREDPTEEKHVRFGLLDEQDLPALRDAIDLYLHNRYLEDMAEHVPPR